MNFPPTVSFSGGVLFVLVLVDEVGSLEFFSGEILGVLILSIQSFLPPLPTLPVLNDIAACLGHNSLSFEWEVKDEGSSQQSQRENTMLFVRHLEQF